jgi:asparagine synthase (glutamine-hydrolysing)
MCGFAGILGSAWVKKESLQRMVVEIHHRGPDDYGVLCDSDAGIGLAHARLSVLDLSPAGHQPMHSACGRYVIVFNGEIYNFRFIREQLEKLDSAPAWRGESDTEVMLAAISHWGPEAAVKRFVGMFAFALWDKQERSLYLTRDRLGEKPLYYGWMNDVFLFGSELKAFKAHPAWRGEINRDALALFMRHNYIPTPYSIYKDIYKLFPGTILILTAGDVANRRIPKVRPYWSAKTIAESGVESPFTGDANEAVAQLDALLRSAVAEQMVADVPLGAFLSGGIDSSAVVALMQVQSSRPVKTFSIGLHETGYNEARHAKAVARHLGTNHTELYVTSEEAMKVIPRLPTLYDEPFADSSQIPTFLVSQLTREHVTVSLSGDGGDELFGGYNRYFMGKAIRDKVGWMPLCCRNLLAVGLQSLSPNRWNSLFTLLGSLLPMSFNHLLPGDKLHKLAMVLPANSPEDMYYALISHWKEPAEVVLNATEPLTTLTDRNRWPDLSNFTHHMMYLDLMTYLPDDILTKVDRASMGVSLEARVPILDHRVVEFAWSLPLSMKICNGQGKWILRQVLYKYVPRELVERPKSGFGIPIDLWLRGPLRDWAEALLNESRLRQEGFFDPQPIRQKWTEHLSGKRNWAYHLWDVLIFQGWLERNT